MTEDVRELHERVLSLPPDQRAELVELLLASLQPMSAAQRAWAQLANRRREDVRSGRVAMVPGGDALARIRSAAEVRSGAGAGLGEAARADHLYLLRGGDDDREDADSNSVPKASADPTGCRGRALTM